jgi:hypothetical protein
LLIPGECYLIVDLTTGKGHLYVVASWPDAHGKALFVNITDERHEKDATCTLNPEDHPFITKPSQANYAESLAMTESKVKAWLTERRMFAKDRANGGMLRRVQDGAKSSKSMNPRHCYFRELMGANQPDQARLREITPKIVVVVKPPSG